MVFQVLVCISPDRTVRKVTKIQHQALQLTRQQGRSLAQQEQVIREIQASIVGAWSLRMVWEMFLVSRILNSMFMMLQLAV
ncbi:TPA: hypothetical protein ACT2H1_001032 [Streptococcus suis]